MKKIEKYSVLQRNGISYVLKIYEGDRPSSWDMPNFMGTGKALAGILKKGETLEEWLKRKEKRLKNIKKYGEN